MSAALYDYYPAVLFAIQKLGEGLSRTKACDAANISVSLFESYVNKDANLQNMLVDAERRGYDAMADALLQPDNHKIYGSSNPAMAKVISDNIKWVLSRRDNKRFGDKVEVKHEVTLDRAITDAIDLAKERARQRVHVIEHDALPPPPPPPPPVPFAVREDVVDVLVDQT